MDTKRVVVTGMGAITPLGNDVESFWQGLVEGRNGIGPISKVDVSNCKAKLAGEVKDFDPKKYMDFKSAKRMGVFSQYTVSANCPTNDGYMVHTVPQDPFDQILRPGLLRN